MRRQIPKKFYAYMQSKKARRECAVTLERADGTLALANKDRTETLLLLLKSVYRQAQLVSEIYQWTRTVPKLGRLDANEDEVLLVLKALNKHKSAGPDCIHQAMVLSKLLTELHRASLKLGELPAE